MSVYAGPEFSESSVVFHYDMNNKKSYAGPPTTNHVPNADTMPGWSTYGGTPVAFQTEFGTTGYRMSNAPSWNGIYRGITIPSTGVYTFSVWARYLGGSPNNNGGGVYISGWGGSDSASVTNRTQLGQWQRLSITLNCTTTSMTFYLISYGGTNDGTSDRSSWEVTMPQAEAGSVATTFVSGTRSSTQAVRDLMGQNTLTASNLTYTSNDVFAFNGSSSVVTSPFITLNFSAGVSMEMIFRSTDIQSRAQGYMSFSPGPQYINFYSGGNSALRWETWQNNSTSVGGAFTSPANLLNNTWYHAVGTYSSNGASRLYINGAQVGSATYAATSYGSLTASIRVGEYAGYLSGNIAVSKIYNRALSAAEVYSNYTAIRLRYGI
jgi:hypothetical protein